MRCALVILSIGVLACSGEDARSGGAESSGGSSTTSSVGGSAGTGQGGSGVGGSGGGGVGTGGAGAGGTGGTGGAGGTSGAGGANGGVPYGFWGLNGYHSPGGLADVATRFNANVVQLASSNPMWTVNTFLPMARDAGWRVTLRMTGGHSEYTTNGDFDIAKWKVKLDLWRDYPGLAGFVSDGTLMGHMVLDDIGNWSYPNGFTDPTGDELDEMARYSKQTIPGLMTFVRQRCKLVPEPGAGSYQRLDACVNQYRSLEGDVNTYAVEQRNAALALGLGIINGLNLCDGGDGSSGQQGWRGAGFWAMSAQEVTTYGNALMVDGLGLFLNWEYDGEEAWPDTTVGSAYFDTPAMQNALADLGRLVAQQPTVNLLGP